MKITKSELKMLAMESVVESKLDKDTKIKHLEYIKEKADPYQCIGYILDGKFYNLNEQGKINLKERFLSEKDGYHPYRKTFFAHYGGPTGSAISGLASGIRASKQTSGSIKNKLAVGSAVGAIVAGSGIARWAGYRAIRSAFDECTKECGTFKINNPKRQLCLFRCKAVRLGKEIEALKRIHGNSAEIAEKQDQLKKVKETIVRYEARYKK